VAKGNFINGEPDGKIIFTLKSGKTKEEMWKNGKKL
jgi:antitoxin component YwqK of YwqJK toxin-antitoxin module